MCQEVEEMILQDCRINVIVIAHELSISAGSFQYHLFSLDDVKGQFLIGATNVDSWAESMPSAREFRHYKNKPRKLLKNYYRRWNMGPHHDPETKQESMQWKHKGFPIPKKCVQQSARNIKATVFFFFGSGVFVLEFMPHKTTITGDTYEGYTGKTIKVHQKSKLS